MKRMTNKEVAQRAGVSRSVVSAVLNGTPGIRVSQAKRQEILQIIEQLGYQVNAQARSLKTGRSYTLGVSGQWQSPFLAQALEGIQAACLERGYHVLLHGSRKGDEGRQQLLEWYAQHRIDGMITQDVTSYNNLEWAAEILKRNIPYVSLEGYAAHKAISSVMMDYAGSIERAADYLVQLTGLPPVYLEMYQGPAYRPNWGDQQRLHSYERWARSRQQQPEVWQVARHAWPRQAQIFSDWLRQREGPTAVLSNWSIGANHLYRAAYALDLRIGRDLYVMAADDSERVNEWLIPRLTCVQVPYAEMGRAAAERLIDGMDGGTFEHADMLLPPRLFIGESAGEQRTDG